MGYRLDDFDRDILEFRPRIDYVEPDQKPGEIEGVDYPQLEDIQDARSKIKRLAHAVNVLAGAMQARVDSKAEDMVITLDPNVDQDAIQAMRRRYPGADPTKITYAQYRTCKDGLRAHGEEVAKQAIITPEQVARARDDLYAGGLIGGGAPGRDRSAILRSGGVISPTTGTDGPIGAGGGTGTGGTGRGFGLNATGLGDGLGDKSKPGAYGLGSPLSSTGGAQTDSNAGTGDGGGLPEDTIGGGGGRPPIPGGYDKENAGSGGFRPELNSNGQIIQPLDIETMQIDLICILVNFVWKNFIKVVLTSLPFPVGPPMNLLPDKLCDPGLDFEIPGLFILGQKPDDLLTGKAAATATERILTAAAEVAGEIINE